MENLKETGTFTIDELGRIIIPTDVRAKLGWGEKDTISFQFADNNALTLQLAEKNKG